MADKEIITGCFVLNFSAVSLSCSFCVVDNQNWLLVESTITLISCCLLDLIVSKGVILGDN